MQLVSGQLPASAVALDFVDLLTQLFLRIQDPKVVAGVA